MGENLPKIRSFAELMDYVEEEAKRRIKIYVVPEKISFIARSGRVPELIAKLSGIVDKFKVLPIIEYSREKFRIYKIVRGMENAIRELSKLVRGEIAVIGSTYAPELEEKLAE